MFGMVLERVFIPELTKVTGDIERKIVAVGISKLLTECQSMITPPYRTYWSPILQALIQLFELPSDEDDGIDDEQIDNKQAEYQAAYSQLNFARSKTNDPIADVNDGRRYLVESLAKLSQSRPGDLPTMISAMPTDHQHALQKYCAQAGVQIN